MLFTADNRAISCGAKILLECHTAEENYLNAVYIDAIVSSSISLLEGSGFLGHLE